MYQLLQVKWVTPGKSVINLIFKEVVHALGPVFQFTAGIRGIYHEGYNCIKYPLENILLFQDSFSHDFNDVEKGITCRLLDLKFSVMKSCDHRVH